MRVSRVRIVGWLLGVSLSSGALAPAASRAQERESEELRALRLAEYEIFPPHDEPPADPAPASLGLLPPSLTSAVPDAAPLVAEGRRRDLSWLEGLALPDIPVRWDERVIRYLEFFRDDPRGRALIRGWMARMERYGPMIRDALRREGMPEDILYLAMIESGFDPRARSGAGAVGLWQFVGGTGAEYGLAQSHWLDERMDPEASTRAGARYLGALHERFGTWELAFAAYNMGYGALLRAIRRYGTNDYWRLTRLEAALPFETNLYVAKVMACAIVGRNLERFGLGDLAREAPLAWDEVQVPGGTTLQDVARASGTSLEELRRLNPALRHDRAPPGRELFDVRVGSGAGATFARQWPRVRPSRPANAPYVVRFGEDLTSIARRFRTTEAALRTLNALSDAESVRPGFDLMVPAVAPRAESFAEPPVVVVPPRTFRYEGRQRVFYRVARGDRLADVARFFGVTEAEIREWNEVDPRATLQDGLFLQLFVPRDFDTATALVLSPEEVRLLVMGSEEFYEHHVRQEGRVRLRYRVRERDTLSSIATRFGISIGSVCRINIMPRDTVLAVGQELIVYTTPDRVPAELRGQVEASAPPLDAGSSDRGEGASASGDAETEGEAGAPSDAPPSDAPSIEGSPSAGAPSSDAPPSDAPSGDASPPGA